MKIPLWRYFFSLEFSLDLTKKTKMTISLSLVRPTQKHPLSLRNTLKQDAHARACNAVMKNKKTKDIYS